MKYQIAKLLFLFFTLIFILGCSYGPTGIFATIEVEREVKALSALEITAVQSLSVDGLNAVVSSLAVHTRTENTPESLWPATPPPENFQNSLGSALINGDIWSVYFNNTNTTGLFRRTGTDWVKNTSSESNFQGVYGDGTTGIAVARTTDSTITDPYQLYRVNTTSDLPELGKVTGFPKGYVNVGNIVNGEFVLTTEAVFDLNGDEITGSPDSPTAIGKTADNNLLLVGTKNGTIHGYNGTGWTNLGAIETEGRGILALYHYNKDVNFLLVSLAGDGYYVAKTPLFSGVNTFIKSSASISREYGNIRDTGLYENDITHFASGPDDGIYMAVPGKGLWYGSVNSFSITWQKLSE